MYACAMCVRHLVGVGGYPLERVRAHRLQVCAREVASTREIDYMGAIVMAIAIANIIAIAPTTDVALSLSLHHPP